MFRISLIVGVLLFVGGCSDSLVKSQGGEIANPLIGEWTPDIERTVSELKVNGDVENSIIKCYEFGDCGAFSVIYGNREYETVMYRKNGDILSRAKASYKVVDISDEYVVIDTFENGGVVKFHFVASGAYINLQGFKEYFRKTNIVEQ